VLAFSVRHSINQQRLRRSPLVKSVSQCLCAGPYWMLCLLYTSCSDFPTVSKPPFALSDSYSHSPRRSHLAEAGGSTRPFQCEFGFAAIHVLVSSFRINLLQPHPSRPRKRTSQTRRRPNQHLSSRCRYSCRHFPVIIRVKIRTTFSSRSCPILLR
jgi:hypothetical protein